MSARKFWVAGLWGMFIEKGNKAAHNLAWRAQLLGPEFVCMEETPSCTADIIQTKIIVMAVFCFCWLMKLHDPPLK